MTAYHVCRATLVVCAVSLVGQWMDEARNKLNGSLRLYQYHGSSRVRNLNRLATEYDLVVTTYQVSTSCLWRRLLVRLAHFFFADEKHNIRGSFCGIFHAKGTKQQASG